MAQAVKTEYFDTMNYAEMATHYDDLMTSGYYDYFQISDDLALYPGPRVLELGCGTGLILEQVGDRRPDWDLTGIDITPQMLTRARARLRGYPKITLREANAVTLSLGGEFDLAFSYGGPWYFVPGPDGFTMISHIRDDQLNQDALARVAAHLRPGSRLLLGIQPPHATYCGPIDNGMIYTQRIDALDGGFRKHYSLADDGQIVMQQTTDYRTYPFRIADQMLQDAGLDYEVHPAVASSLFLEFRKR